MTGFDERQEKGDGTRRYLSRAISTTLLLVLAITAVFLYVKIEDRNDVCYWTRSAHQLVSITDSTGQEFQPHRVENDYGRQDHCGVSLDAIPFEDNYQHWFITSGADGIEKRVGALQLAVLLGGGQTPSGSWILEEVNWGNPVNLVRQPQVQR